MLSLCWIWHDSLKLDSVFTFRAQTLLPHTKLLRYWEPCSLSFLFPSHLILDASIFVLCISIKVLLICTILRLANYEIKCARTSKICMSKWGFVIVNLAISVPISVSTVLKSCVCDSLLKLWLPSISLAEVRLWWCSHQPAREEIGFSTKPNSFKLNSCSPLRDCALSVSQVQTTFLPWKEVEEESQWSSQEGPPLSTKPRATSGQMGFFLLSVSYSLGSLISQKAECFLCAWPCPSSE